MKLRKYFFASFVLIVFIGAVVHFKHESDFTTDFFGTFITLPMSVWFSLPLLIMFIATLLHFSYYSFKNYLKNRGINKDRKNFIETIKKSLLAEKSNFDFKNEEYKNLATLFANSKIYLQDTSIKTNIEEIDKIIQMQKSIQSSENVSLKTYNLSDNNEYKIQNIKNKINNDVKFAKEVLRNNTSYSEDILKTAFERIILEKNENDIKNGIKNISIDKNIALKLLDLYGDVLHINYEEIKNIVNEAKFNNLDFIALAKELKPKMIPDDLISMFNKLSDDIDSAKDGYVYILLDLEMLDIAKEYLENIDPSELLIFRAYLALKDSGKDYLLDDFIKGIN